MKVEQWLPIIGFEDIYEASNLGRIRSLPRLGTNGKVMKPTNGAVILVIGEARHHRSVYQLAYSVFGDELVYEKPLKEAIRLTGMTEPELETHRAKLREAPPRAIFGKFIAEVQRRRDDGESDANIFGLKFASWQNRFAPALMFAPDVPPMWKVLPESCLAPPKVLARYKMGGWQDT